MEEPRRRLPASPPLLGGSIFYEGRPGKAAGASCKTLHRRGGGRDVGASPPPDPAKWKELAMGRFLDAEGVVMEEEERRDSGGPWRRLDPRKDPLPATPRAVVLLLSLPASTLTFSLSLSLESFCGLGLLFLQSVVRKPLPQKVFARDQVVSAGNKEDCGCKGFWCLGHLNRLPGSQTVAPKPL
uniref:uncharacterized protein LOC114605317 isoform X2 n=1 Tax=Podarcis muralis TaxID=64176 RepID=UPI00109F13CF|nr:uncharacterized protein LOC114605317 isoform X2 [Podarcis muralis]